jgi:hypothetical protein
MFYHYSQNNSGGSFYIDHRVAHHVIIEADTAEQANQIAESKGLYWNGCDLGLDCDCCGDRWYPQWRDDGGDAEPLIYDLTPDQYQDHSTAHDDPYCHVYYLDGTQKTYRTYKPPKAKPKRIK